MVADAANSGPEVTDAAAKATDPSSASAGEILAGTLRSSVGAIGASDLGAPIPVAIFDPDTDAADERPPPSAWLLHAASSVADSYERYQQLGALIPPRFSAIY